MTSEYAPSILRSVWDKMIFAAVQTRLRHQMQNDFAVHGRLENRAAIFQFVAQLRRVRQISVVRDGDLPARAIHGERLRVFQLRRAGGGIARVADGGFADEAVQNFAVENLRHEAHAVMLVKFPVVASDDARAFLPAMLERVKAVVGQFGGVRMAENAEDSAIMFGIKLFSLHRARR